jgi:hypothetical protein
MAKSRKSKAVPDCTAVIQTAIREDPQALGERFGDELSSYLMPRNKGLQEELESRVGQYTTRARTPQDFINVGEQILSAFKQQSNAPRLSQSDITSMLCTAARGFLRKYPSSKEGTNWWKKSPYKPRSR